MKTTFDIECFLRRNQGTIIKLDFDGKKFSVKMEGAVAMNATSSSLTGAMENAVDSIREKGLGKDPMTQARPAAPAPPKAGASGMVLAPLCATCGGRPRFSQLTYVRRSSTKPNVHIYSTVCRSGHDVEVRVGTGDSVQFRDRARIFDGVQFN